MSECCTCFHSCLMCFQYFLFLFVFPCLSAKQGNTTTKGHQSNESPSASPSQNGTTILRTQPRRETTANVTTPQPESTTQLSSTTTTTNQKSVGAASQGAVSTTSSQQTAEIKPSKSTTKQKSTAGKRQNQFGNHGNCSSWLC